MLAETLCRQPGGAHFLEEFSGSTGIELAAEQLTDFGRLGLELLDQTADVIAVARQLRFEIIDLAGQNGLRRQSMPTRRRSGSRAKAQNRSQAHIWRRPSAGRCASQSSIRECGSLR
jgi:hypothetical protein